MFVFIFDDCQFFHLFNKKALEYYIYLHIHIYILADFNVHEKKNLKIETKIHHRRNQYVKKFVFHLPYMKIIDAKQILLFLQNIF